MMNHWRTSSMLGGGLDVRPLNAEMLMVWIDTSNVSFK
jgi:hypothetical protein